MADPTGISESGAEAVIAALERIYEEIGQATIQTAELSSRDRVNIAGTLYTDEFSNTELAQWHIDSHKSRDVITPTDETAEKCAQAFVDVLEVEIQRMLNRGKGRKPGGPFEDTGNKRGANSLMAMGLRAAMKVYLETCFENLKNQKNSDGSGFADLDPKYAEKKQSDVGFSIPILVRTGQLRDALDPSQIAKNIKFTTKSGQ